MPTSRPRVITDLLEEHFEELSFLWGQRLDALNSPVLTLRNVHDLEERIEAHVEGLLVGEEDIIPLLSPRLLDSSSNEAFAAAYPLLRLGRADAAQLVWNAFTQAQGGSLTGLSQALCACCPPELKPQLMEAAGGLPSPRTAAALEVLAFCSRADIKTEKLLSLLKADSPHVREAGWRIVALADFTVPRETYEQALSDEDPRVRHECLWAAAWTRQPWVLDYCRKFATKDASTDTAPIRLLAILGQPDDLQRMLRLATNTAFGPQRFEWLGTYGYPETMDTILAGFKSPNPREAVAAGNAFTKITSFDVSSNTRVQLPPEDGGEPDEFEKEFLEDAFLPDFAKAETYWQTTKDHFTNGKRWGRGHKLDQSVSMENPIEFDTRLTCDISVRSGIRTVGKRFPLDMKYLTTLQAS